MRGFIHSLIWDGASARSENTLQTKEEENM